MTGVLNSGTGQGQPGFRLPSTPPGNMGQRVGCGDIYVYCIGCCMFLYVILRMWYIHMLHVHC